MNVQIFPSGPLLTNAYVLSSDKSNQAIIIDPAFDSAGPIESYLGENQLEADKIILTHSHWDHFGDLAKIKEKTKAKVYVHSKDRENLEDPGSDQLPMIFPMIGTKPDVLLEEGDKIYLDTYEFQVIHTPGHTPGGICLYCPQCKILISGDTLFKGSIGNLSFPTASAEDMWTSLEKLSILPGSTKVYPGHGDITTIGEENWLKNAKQIFS